MEPTNTLDDFRELMGRIRSGDPEAAWRLVERYGPHVHRFVRRNLHRQLRPKFDSLDFVQVIWASIFRAPNKLQRVNNPEELLGFLATMAKYKVLSEVRRRRGAAKYDVEREVPLQGAADEAPYSAARTPTPSAILMAKERWERMLDGQKDDVRKIASLRLQGVSFVEIASKLQIHERTARKAIERLTALDVYDQEPL